ncbi:MAG: tRNA (adenosine(37)-N6)-threonylcarbamoyltransferase complex ATPase subunit type 1 TsaE [Erysipelotrichaceae bacterium]|jgi:tRNA threonylcarbamoyladenosine biosynthesis protein TsaE|nr:tRNA (adenosine(37)-N6)-threonylcarbamoyltransferase complex ATPase subunit type 1 TsaE [Erysipelotrichaceae bacterium]
MLKKIVTHQKEDTIKLASKIANSFFKGAIITLTGDLGAGKTTFVSGLAKGLGIDESITSPTFNILKCYFHKPISLFHIDAYRLDGANKDIGLEEFIEGDDISVIEWPSFIDELIPANRLEVKITNLGDNVRELIFMSDDLKYRKVFDALEVIEL